MHDKVDVAGEGGSVTGAIGWQLSPGGSGALEKDIVPLNWPTPVIVMVEVAPSPTLTATGEVAVIVKSAGSVNDTVTVCERDPLVPVTVTVRTFVDVD